MFLLLSKTELLTNFPSCSVLANFGNCRMTWLCTEFRYRGTFRMQTSNKCYPLNSTNGMRWRTDIATTLPVSDNTCVQTEHRQDHMMTATVLVESSGRQQIHKGRRWSSFALHRMNFAYIHNCSQNHQLCEEAREDFCESDFRTLPAVDRRACFTGYTALLSLWPAAEWRFRPCLQIAHQSTRMHYMQL